LISSCWVQSPDDRPSFEALLKQLKILQGEQFSLLYASKQPEDNSNASLGNSTSNNNSTPDANYVAMNQSNHYVA
jgi:hypothetical protein